MKLNKEFHAASKIQNKVHNVKASGSILAVNLPSDHDNNSDSSFIDLSNDDDSDLELKILMKKWICGRFGYFIS